MRSKRYREDVHWEDLLEESAERETKFKVTVEFFLTSDGHEEAQAKIHELIKEGILALSIDDEKDIEYSYDVTDCEVAELDI